MNHRLTQKHTKLFLFLLLIGISLNSNAQKADCDKLLPPRKPGESRVTREDVDWCKEEGAYARCMCDNSKIAKEERIRAKAAEAERKRQLEAEREEKRRIKIEQEREAKLEKERLKQEEEERIKRAEQEKQEAAEKAAEERREKAEEKIELEEERKQIQQEEYERKLQEEIRKEEKKARDRQYELDEKEREKRAKERSNIHASNSANLRTLISQAKTMAPGSPQHMRTLQAIVDLEERMNIPQSQRYGVKAMQDAAAFLAAQLAIELIEAIPEADHTKTNLLLGYGKNEFNELNLGTNNYLIWGNFYINVGMMVSSYNVKAWQFYKDEITLDRGKNTNLYNNSNSPHLLVRHEEVRNNGSTSNRNEYTNSLYTYNENLKGIGFGFDMGLGLSFAINHTSRLAIGGSGYYIMNTGPLNYIQGYKYGFKYNIGRFVFGLNKMNSFYDMSSKHPMVMDIPQNRQKIYLESINSSMEVM
jgi:hypothetical protein